MSLLAKKILRHPFRQRPEQRYPASLMKEHHGRSLSEDESMVSTDTSFDSDGHSPIHDATVAAAADAMETSVPQGGRDDERRTPTTSEHPTPRVRNHERNRNRVDSTTIEMEANEASPIHEDATTIATTRATRPGVKNEPEESSSSLGRDTVETQATNNARGASENEGDQEEEEAPRFSGDLANVKLEGQARMLQSHLPEGGYWHTSHRKRKRKPTSHHEFLYESPPPPQTQTTKKGKQSQPIKRKQKLKQPPQRKPLRTETTKTSEKEIQIKYIDSHNVKPSSSLPSIAKDKIPKELRSHCTEGKAGYWEMDFSDTKRRRRSKPTDFLELTTEKQPQQKPRAKHPSTKMAKKPSNQTKSSCVSKTSEFRQKLAPKQPKEKQNFPSISNTSEAIGFAEKRRETDSPEKPSATKKASQAPIPKFFIPRNLQTHCEDPSGGYWDIDFSSRRRRRPPKIENITIEPKRKQKRGKTARVDKFEKTQQAPKDGSKEFPIDLEANTTKGIAGPKKITGTTKWAWDNESSLKKSSKEPNQSLPIELGYTNPNAIVTSASPKDNISLFDESSKEPNKRLPIESESTNANATEVRASPNDNISSLNESSKEPNKSFPIESESNITETSASSDQIQMKGPRKILATNQWGWLIPLDPEPEESFDDNLETNSPPKKKRRPRRCLRCVEHGASSRQAMECIGSKPRFGRNACEFFAADIGAKPAAKPRAKPAKKAKIAVHAEPESEPEPESGSELPSIDGGDFGDIDVTWYFPSSEEREKRPEERKRRRCMRCVQNGAPSSQAEECNGSKGHLGRDACQHFDSNGCARTTEPTTHQEAKNKNIILRVIAGNMRMGRPLVASNLPPSTETPQQERRKKKKKKKPTSPARSQDAMSNRKFENFMNALKDAADLIDSESKRGHFDYPKPDEAVVLV